MTALIDTLRQALAPWRNSAAWVLALSGGCDSRLLLALLAEWRDTGEPLPPLRAIHIDHGLAVKSADWVAQCQAWCDAAAVPLSIHRVTLEGRRQGLESLARTARYAVFARELGDSELLLMAHHQDDQAETLMLRLLRGGGVQGLSAMPCQRPLGRGVLFRPLLSVPRATLEREARDRQLQWIQDPSNTDTRFDRNFLRHRVLPMVAERWPDFRRRLQRAAGLQRETAQLLDEYLGEDLDAMVGADGELDLDKLGARSLPRQRALLRFFMQRLGLRQPDQAQLNELLRQCHCADDRQPSVSLQGVVFRRFRQRLYCLAGNCPPLPAAAVIWHRLDSPLEWAGGQLAASPGGQFQPRGRVTVVRREEGMRCRLAGEGRSRPLKKVLQERGVPPWLRDSLPLVLCDGELAAIADFALCEGFQVAEGQGWRLRWTAATSCP